MIVSEQTFVSEGKKVVHVKPSHRTFNDVTSTNPNREVVVHIIPYSIANVNTGIYLPEYR